MNSFSVISPSAPQSTRIYYQSSSSILPIISSNSYFEIFPSSLASKILKAAFTFSSETNFSWFIAAIKNSTQKYTYLKNQPDHFNSSQRFVIFYLLLSMLNHDP